MKNRGAWLAVATSLAAVLACGSSNNGTNNSGNGSGNSGFPFSGPSCGSTIFNESCWGCLQNSCNGGCLTSACSDFFNCFCNCAPGSENCYQGCASSISPSCQQCVLSVSSCEMNSCSSDCGNVGAGNSSGGVIPPGMGSGGSGGSSSGGGMFQSCGGSGQVCAGGESVQFCQAGFGNMCTSAFYQVGNQTFPCASCSDTASCQQQAQAACSPIFDAGPPPPPSDAEPPDAPFIDGGATCNSRACGTMGQSMTFCESIDPSGTCTAAWFEVGGLVFDCNSCTDCTTASQEASKSCP
jgi:hypothetical protein